jgi:hypothetical protein
MRDKWLRRAPGRFPLHQEHSRQSTQDDDSRNYRQ